MSVQPARRYSEAFKMQVISELESGKLRSQCEARRKYGIQGNGTIAKWLRKYGKPHLIPGVQTMITPDENNRLRELEQENRRLKQALADAHLDSVLYQAWFKIACQHGGVQDLEAFKKKHESKLWQ
jgi:transposase-like protein